MADKAMLIEGSGNFKCHHDFETNDVNLWNDHCSDPANNHTESGISACSNCGETIVFDNIPFHPIKADGSKGISLRCGDCEESYREVFKNNQIRKVSNPQEGITMKQPEPEQEQSHKRNTNKRERREATEE